ncbi:hypothetical protein NUH88_05325 [Nisaea acidiphila]|uniref:Uncharacterized protein n=1 Tax=Nisaea acidiphila TaxID=1862145 RepID=A0A9J7AVG3_9PROT|nr:hypothetical protein [Nisaea acidiphila]UUX51110.1 hypothetical protein NUH88_05325 [Nisaea acidiphila]
MTHCQRAARFAAAIALCWIIVGCSSATTSFKDGPSPGKAVVIVGGAFRIPNVPISKPIAPIHIVAGPLKVPSAILSAQINFRRFEVNNGKKLSNIGLSFEGNPELIMVGLGEPNSLFGPGRTLDQFGRTTYAIAEVNPGDWFLERQIVSSPNQTTIIHSLKQEDSRMREGIPIFSVEAGETIYVGDVFLVSSAFLKEHEPSKHQRLGNDQWFLGYSFDFVNSIPSIASRIDAASIKERKLVLYDK